MSKKQNKNVNTKEFRAESKRLLDLMINSVYTNKEIFLRELISNSSDALDKLYFASLTDTSLSVTKDDLKIVVQGDSEKRELCIADNGIGMTEQDLDNNLGTIAKSGSNSFKQRSDLKKAIGEADIDIIGQFGVGFYSAFMVADSVEVMSKVQGSDGCFVWTSSGLDGYSIQQASNAQFDEAMNAFLMKPRSGTIVKLHLKKDSDIEDDFKFDDLLSEFTITSLVKKYSDYIRYPIQTLVKDKVKQGDDFVENLEVKTLNSQIPIWKKRKDQVSKDDYNKFYNQKFFDYNAPLKYIATRIEGSVDFDALLYIPSTAPFDYFAKDFQKGLQLYASGVLITEKCAELLPDYLGFVRGVVDSNDLSLNISREVLQHDTQLKKIATALDKKLRAELVKMQQDTREDYDQFFEAFGLTLKFGAYDNFGVNKEKLIDLLMFYSSTQKKLVTFKEYISRMKEEQKHIYYATGQSVAQLERLPASERVREQGYEILYLTENIDEFCIKIIDSFDKHKFMSIASPDLDIGTTDDLNVQTNKNKSLLKKVKEVLKDKVVDVKISHRLKTHAVCLSAKGQISIEMEKVLSGMPDKSKANARAEKVLEFNPNHKVFERLQELFASKSPDFEKVTRVLYTTARLIEGLTVEDSVEFSEDLCSLI
ncbi:MAG: molecular chaperone HtpG [Clostridiales bacterium]|jgi:molecular chaperone HtpG|nr:molecular chaperone HtpG [Clostridiales bacterium]